MNTNPLYPTCSLVAIAWFAAAPLAFPDSASDGIPYRLLDGSTLYAECLPCARPPFIGPIAGGFKLRPKESNPLFNTYEVAELSFSTLGLPQPEYQGLGQGTYRIGGEVALLQEMNLAVDINEFKGLKLESGLASPPASFPWIEIDLKQVLIPDFIWYFELHLVAVPWPEIWFSTQNGFHPSNPQAAGADFVSDGALLSSSGAVVRANQQLTRSLGIMPMAPDIGLDAVLKAPEKLTGGPPSIELWFSAAQDVFSETIGPLGQGDLLSDAGKIVRRNLDLIAPFSPMPPIPDMGLDAVSFGPDGKLLFSTRDDFFSEKLGVKIDRGDLLREDGTIFKTQAELLARFKPAAAGKSFGLDAVHLWPHGEVWFSTEASFEDGRLGHIGHGDVLSDNGRVVIRNLDLLGPFGPLEDLADFGLDALWVDLSRQFDGCGTLVQGAECVLFAAESGGWYVLENLGGFKAGDRVRAAGTIDPDCATICMQGEGCIRQNTIALCPGEPVFHRGDANDDGSMDISDAVFILYHLFLGTVDLPCEEAADADDLGGVEITDAIRLLHHLFLGGPPPEAPGPPPLPCGPDPESSPARLGCGLYTHCASG
ncbi:MAG: hypothetical protein HY717_12535 [Planctomycetes bacterium]|nr:hypothetical protein [Planctomycetota bacterium]